jgi:hypothetical protein
LQTPDQVFRTPGDFAWPTPLQCSPAKRLIANQSTKEHCDEYQETRRFRDRRHRDFRRAGRGADAIVKVEPTVVLVQGAFADSSLHRTTTYDLGIERD